MLLLISEASMVCVTLDVTDATTTTVPVMATSILVQAFISSLARLRRVEDVRTGKWMYVGHICGSGSTHMDQSPKDTWGGVAYR